MKKEAEHSSINAQKENGALKGHGAESIKRKKNKKCKECAEDTNANRATQCSRIVMRPVSH